MVNEVFASDETVALAKQKACDMLGVSEQNVEFEVLRYPSKKVLGMFGGKMAQVRAVVKKTPAQKARDYLKEVLFYMGLGSLDVLILSENEESCDLKITGDTVGFVVGRHGETLDSLQYLAGLVANNKNQSGVFCKIRLEAGDYREQRKKTLEALGRRIAEKALRTGKKINLEPMRSYERKIVHTAIGDIPGTRSWSEDEGVGRHVVVAPDEQESEREQIS